MKRWAYIFAKIKLVYENHHPLFWKLLCWLLIRRAERTMGCKYPSVHRAVRSMTPRPIMFIHGQRDSYIRDDQTRLLYGAAAAPKYMWIVPGAKHNQSALIEPDAYARRTVAFFRKHLADEAIDESVIHGAADENTDFQVA
jgi:pimeloyl-ACP methyl ester carboxylesterase